MCSRFTLEPENISFPEGTLITECPSSAATSYGRSAVLLVEDQILLEKGRINDKIIAWATM